MSRGEAEPMTLLQEIERYARIYARWERGEVSDRVYANARKRIEKAVAR